MCDSIQIQIHVQFRPVEVLLVMQFNHKKLFQCSRAEPWKVIEREKMFAVVHKNPETQFRRAKSSVDRQLNCRFQLEFGFAVRRNHMHMQARFFSREEIEPVIAKPENRRTHGRTIPNQA